MTITFEVLGEPGRDNAVLVRVDSGQSVERLLFDCGERCLDAVPFSDVQAIDHLCFSHLHMDHVAGFDHFFRCVYDRDTKPNRIWGPPETARILHHRFRGFLWNLHADMTGTWRVTDIAKDETCTFRFELAEAFKMSHAEGTAPRQPKLFEGGAFVVESYTMDHRTPTIACVVREKTRSNIDMARLSAMGLTPGPWMKIVKDVSDSTESISINGQPYPVAALQNELLIETPGDSFAYLTDFLLDEAAMAELAVVLKGCKTIVCESQYRHADLELARKHFHMTTTLTGQLAARAEAGNLVLFHLSDRYQRSEWLQMLDEVRQQFPATSFPPAWRLGQ